MLRDAVSGEIVSHGQVLAALDILHVVLKLLFLVQLLSIAHKNCLVDLIWIDSRLAWGLLLVIFVIFACFERFGVCKGEGARCKLPLSASFSLILLCFAHVEICKPLPIHILLMLCHLGADFFWKLRRQEISRNKLSTRSLVSAGELAGASFR